MDFVSDWRGQTTFGATLSRATKLRGRRGRKTPEEAARQAAAIVDHDAPAGNAGLVQNHGAYIARDFGSAICVVNGVRHSGMLHPSRHQPTWMEQTRNLEIPGSMLRIAPE
jgi:hypothetical protein